jgi:hypothetical protein
MPSLLRSPVFLAPASIWSFHPPLPQILSLSLSKLQTVCVVTTNPTPFLLLQKIRKITKKKMPAFNTTHKNSLHSQLQSLAVELLSRFRHTATTTFPRALDSRGSRSKSAARVRKKRKGEERRRSKVQGLIHIAICLVSG